MKKNETVRVTFTDMNSLGYGVGRIDNKVIFVPDAVTGDEADVKIIKDGGSYYAGKIERPIVLSPFRTDSRCAAFPKCGGCSFCHISYEYEKELKERFVKGFLMKEGLSHIPVLPILSTGVISGYRNKVQFPYKDGKLGYYAPHSHRVVENNGCALHKKEMEPVLSEVASFLRENNVESYDEESGKGLLRHIYLRTNGDGSEMLLTLVINGRSFPKKDALLSLLREKHPCVTGVLLNVNTEKSNVILGNEYILLYGKETMCDSLLSCTFEMSPASFYQVNREGAELLYNEVIKRASIKGGETVADLFCGIGTIGMCLSKNSPVGKLVGVEVIPQAVENAKKNALRNHIENAGFYCGDANHPALEKADLVIVDPPRKGLDRELIDRLSALDCKKIVYVSCDPATLARDLAYFEKNGWHIGEVQPVDMFPRTGHVESVVLLSRNDV